MPATMDKEQVLARNPQIDRKKLDEMLETVQRLRQGQDRRKEYDLPPPYGGPGVVAVKVSEEHRLRR